MGRPTLAAPVATLASHRVPALPLGSADRARVEGEPADLDPSGARTDEIGEDLGQDALAIRGGLVPRTGEAVLIKVGARTR